MSRFSGRPHPELVAQAAMVLQDGLRGRTLNHRVTPEARRYNTRYHSKWWHAVYGAVNLVHCCFAFVEEPTTLNRMPPNEGATPLTITCRALEFLPLIVYYYDFFMYFKIRGWGMLKGQGKFWVVLRILFLSFISINTLACLCAPDSVPQWSRPLRPFFTLARFANVRRIYTSILSAGRHVAFIISALGMWCVFAAAVFTSLFMGLDSIDSDATGQCVMAPRERNHSTVFCSTWAGNCHDYFARFDTSLMHLFILITTANFPDVMLPAYNCQSWLAAPLFTIFIFVGIHFLSNLVFAVVVTQFQALTKYRLEKRNARLKAGASRAFELVAAKKQSRKDRRRRRRADWLRNVSLQDQMRSSSGDNSIEATAADGATTTSQGGSEHKTTEDGEPRPTSAGSTSGEGEGGGGGGGGGGGKGKTCSKVIWRELLVEMQRAGAMSTRVPPVVCDAIFDMLDVDSDGSLDKEEFICAVTFCDIRVRGKGQHDSGCFGTRLKPRTCRRREREGAATSRGEARQRRCLERLRHGCGDDSWECCRFPRCEPLRLHAEKCVSSTPWRITFDVIVFLNFVLLCAETYTDAPQRNMAALDDVLHHLSQAIIWVFTLELLVNAFGLGFCFYVRRSCMDCLDALAVLITLGIKFAHAAMGDALPALAADAVLALRVVRVVRLLWLVKRFRAIFETFLRIVQPLCRYLAVVGVVYYAFATVGMEVFANRLDLDPATNRTYLPALNASSYGVTSYGDQNFDSFVDALAVLFAQMVVNNWPIVMEGLVHSIHATDGKGLSWFPYFYFIVFNILCVFVVLNVLVSFLIDAFTSRFIDVKWSVYHADEVKIPVWRDRLNEIALQAGVDLRDWHITLHAAAQGLSAYSDDGSARGSAVNSAHRRLLATKTVSTVKASQQRAATLALMVRSSAKFQCVNNNHAKFVLRKRKHQRRQRRQRMKLEQQKLKAKAAKEKKAQAAAAAASSPSSEEVLARAVTATSGVATNAIVTAPTSVAVAEVDVEVHDPSSGSGSSGSPRRRSGRGSSHGLDANATQSPRIQMTKTRKLTKARAADEDAVVVEGAQQSPSGATG